ncbi:hypothetical protein, partial [Thermus sp.]|uniref:hypothetical protein n=1 Tax=Thermus sp. TaxID=275 RepID=UPI003D0B5401
MRGNLEAYKSFYPSPDPELLKKAGLVRPARPLRFYGRTRASAWPNKHLEEETIPLILEVAEETLGASFAQVFSDPEDYQRFQRALREIAERSLPFYATLRFYEPDFHERVRKPDAVIPEGQVGGHLEAFGALYLHLKRGEPYPSEPEAHYPAVEAMLEGLKALEDLPAPRRFPRLYLHGEAHLRLAVPGEKWRQHGLVAPFNNPAFAPPPDLRQGGHWGYVLYKGLAKWVKREEGIDLDASPERDLYFPYSEIEDYLARMAREGAGTPPYASMGEEKKAYRNLLLDAEDIFARHYLYETVFQPYAFRGLLAMAEDFAREGYLEIPPELPIGHVGPIYDPDVYWGSALLRYVGRWEREDGVPVEVYDPALDFGLALVREEENLGEALSLYTFSRMEKKLSWEDPFAKLSTDCTVLYAFRHTDLPYGYNLASSALFFGPGKGWKEPYVNSRLAAPDRLWELGAIRYERFAKPPTVEPEYAQALVDRVVAAYGGALLQVSGAINASFFPVGATEYSTEYLDWQSLLVDSVRLEGGKLV